MSTLTKIKLDAINDFIKTGKSAGWYSSIKRLYLPIWAAAAPNAIDLIARGSGTFVGSVTHAAGYFQSDGITGLFNTGVSATALGLTTSAGGLAVLVSAAPSGTAFRAFISSSISGTQENYIASDSATNLRFSYNSFANSVIAPLARAQQTGVLSADRFGGVRRVIRRNSSGVSTLVSSAGADAGSVSTGDIALSALSPAGGFISDARIGGAAVTLGLGLTQAEKFTLALKTLWETCTGLTLP